VLSFTRDAYDAIVRRGYGGGDQEVCGVLAGDYGDGESHVTDVYPVENAADTPQVRYAMEPEELLAAIDEVEDAGFDVVGFYHTHPAGPTHPSETDVDRATWRGYSYAICAFDGHPFLGSWRWRGDGFEGERVAVEG
jgi:proteasome lid subunit RPN8/RPN11